MIARGPTDLIISVCVMLAAGGIFLMAFLFWWPLFAYALHYWGL